MTTGEKANICKSVEIWGNLGTPYLLTEIRKSGDTLLIDRNQTTCLATSHGTNGESSGAGFSPSYYTKGK